MNVARCVALADWALPPFRFQEHVVDLWRGAALPDTVWTVSMGALTALACAWLGCFLILQGKALLGDAISHTVLLGIVAAALMTGSLGTGTLLLAAVLTGLATTGLIEGVRAASRIKDDAATAIVFTTLFAAGVLLLSIKASKAHIDPQHALYGLLEFVPSQEKLSIGGLAVPVPVAQMALVCAGLLMGLTAFYKQLLVTTFDPLLAQSLGMRPNLVRWALLAALSTTVVGAFSAVGAVLVVGLLVAPPATAFLLTHRLPWMLFWASVCGVGASLVGYHAACWLDATAAGTMVCVACLWFTLAFLLAPREGVVARWLRRWLLHMRTEQENVARLLLKLGAVPGKTSTPLALLAEAGGRPLAAIRRIARQLRWRGWTESPAEPAAGIRLTERGLAEAQRVERAHRLWEAYLVDRVGIAQDHVHPTAEELEHLLDEQLVARLDDALGHPGVDPHGALIPRIPVDVERPKVFALSRLRIGDAGRLVGLTPPVDRPAPTSGSVATEAVAALHLKLGSQLRVVDRDATAASWTIALDDGRRLTTPHELADQILVEVP